MAMFLLMFFTVTAFDWIEIIKEKRKNDIAIYIILSIIAIIIAYFAIKLNYTNSLAKIIIDIFNIER